MTKSDPTLLSFIEIGEKLASQMANKNDVERAWALRGFLDEFAAQVTGGGLRISSEAGREYRKDYREGREAGAVLMER